MKIGLDTANLHTLHSSEMISNIQTLQDGRHGLASGLFLDGAGRLCRADAGGLCRRNAWLLQQASVVDTARTWGRSASRRTTSSTVISAPVPVAPARGHRRQQNFIGAEIMY